KRALLSNRLEHRQHRVRVLACRIRGQIKEMQDRECGFADTEVFFRQEITHRHLDCLADMRAGDAGGGQAIADKSGERPYFIELSELVGPEFGITRQLPSRYDDVIAI